MERMTRLEKMMSEKDKCVELLTTDLEAERVKRQELEKVGEEQQLEMQKYMTWLAEQWGLAEQERLDAERLHGNRQSEVQRQ